MERSMSFFDKLSEEVQNGIEGKNSGISMGFKRLNKHIGIRKRIYTVIMGATGSGKSAFLHSAYILNPYDWWLKEGQKTGLKLKIILFSMERSKIYTIAKWTSRKIFLDNGILIPIPKLLGWWDTKLTKDEHDLFLMYRDYVDNMLEVIDIVEGPQNPTAAYKYVKSYAENNGKVEQIDEFHKVYIPNTENEIVIPVADHYGLVRLEKGLSKKESIDKLSEYFQFFRDFYGYSPVGISQFNRNLSNPMFQKMESFEPTLDDAKESGRPSEDSDCVLSLFDPIRYNTDDKFYRANNFRSSTGEKFFRNVKILKNSYGSDDLGIGMGFMGSTGIFKELPKINEMEGFDYQEIFNGNYFLEQ